MKIAMQHKDFTIEVFDDPSFSQTSDSPTSYDKIYQPGKNKNFVSVSQHAIIVYGPNAKITSAILRAIAGATSVTSDSVLFDGDNLITRCCNTVFCLTLPDLNLNWMVEAEWATFFSIHKYQDTSRMVRHLLRELTEKAIYFGVIAEQTFLFALKKEILLKCVTIILN